MKKDEREISIVRSSAAEYLTFITATGESDVNAVYFDENVWLTQKMMGLLYHVETHTINYHLKKIFADGEIDESSVIRKFRVTAADGKSYNTNHYNLSAIIAVGNKVDSPRAVQFRKWANRIIEEFTVKGFAMDDERLQNGGTVLTKDYFREQLERIREIRLSERRFYQKITDIYATSIDYDAKAETTRLFFARVQNQLHWAIHGETAAETIYRRADSSKEHMGLTTWKDAPGGKIQKFDVVMAKNYLTQEELSAIARIVNAYLDLAELRAEEEVPMTMEDWAEQFEGVLRLSRKEILAHAGSISVKIAEQHALTEFEKYRVRQDRLYQSDFDRMLLEEAAPGLPAATETETEKDGESELDELIQEYCPKGVEFKPIQEVYQRLRGTPITAAKMKEIEKADGDVRIFAGGKTVIV